MKLTRPAENSPAARRPSSPRSRSSTRFGVCLLGAVICFFLFHSFFEPSLRRDSANEQTRQVGRNARKLRARHNNQWKRHCRELQTLPGNRVLVTGSAGFIGCHTAAALRKRGDGVIGLDNFNDYYPVSLKREREEILKTMGVVTVEGELNNQKLLSAIMERCGITHVVHLAAQAGVRYAKEHPMQYVESNVKGSVTVFEAARQMSVPPMIVYASSSSVYGSNTEVPFSEEDAVDRPTSLYGATKRSVELTAVVYHRLFHLSMTGLRFFTVYGPSGRPDMACFQFAKAIVLQEPIKIYTAVDGTELGRDFTYVDDIVRGIMGAMDTATPSTEKEATNRIFNLGNTNPVSVSKFVHSLERAMGKETNKEHIAIENTGDVLYTHANVTKAHQTFNFTPSISLDEGLDRFAAWFNNYTLQMSDELWWYPDRKTR